MGQFSWLYSDIGTPVYCDDPKEPAYLLIPKEWQEEFGKAYFEEKDYKGYGEFGGKDAYALAAQMNKPEACKEPDGSWKDDDELRDIGINIACYDAQNASLKFPIKITSEPLPYDRVEPSVNDPNQGWHIEEDYDEDEYY